MVESKSHEKILVTGASGRVGRRLVDALIERGDHVRVLILDFDVAPKNVEIVRGSLLNKDVAEEAVKDVDVVYHLAAMLDYTAPKNVMYGVNVTGTKNLVEASSAKKFIYLSSTAVYGYHTNHSITEATPFAPSGFYGKTKMLAEKIVLDKHGIVVRSPDIFGKGFQDGYEYVLKQLEKGTMPIIGSGNNRIHWIHISDLIEALLLAKDKGRPGEVYLVAGKEAKPQKELLELLTEGLNKRPPSRHVSKCMANAMAHYELLSARFRGSKPKVIPEHINKITSDRIFDTSKAQRELGFVPHVGYDTAAKEIVEEYVQKSVKYERKSVASQ
jgi:nucleoside-diphosphate-sugar epimerase